MSDLTIRNSQCLIYTHKFVFSCILLTVLATLLLSPWILSCSLGGASISSLINNSEGRPNFSFSGTSAALIRPIQVRGSHTTYRQMIGINALARMTEDHHRNLSTESLVLFTTQTHPIVRITRTGGKSKAG